MTMTKSVATGILLDETVYYSLEEVCRVCDSRSDWVVELVEYGVLRPAGRTRSGWRFPGDALHTAMKAQRLQRDLGLNLPGVALALELLDEIESLQSRLSMLER